jgi:glutaminase
MGILVDDPRIQRMIEYFDERCEQDINIVQLIVAMSGKGVSNNPHIQFLVRVMTSDLKVPEFPSFTQEIKELFKQCKNNMSGKPADYIPELAKGPPKNWGLSICTVEGQRLHLG